MEVAILVGSLFLALAISANARGIIEAIEGLKDKCEKDS